MNEKTNQPKRGSMSIVPRVVRGATRAATGRGRGKKAPPSRQDEGRQQLEELKLRGEGVFREVVKMGPSVLRITKVVKSGARPLASDDPEAGPLDLLLRLSEGLGIESSYARILRGAAKTFATRGFEDTAIQDILDSAGVSPRTFYQFFANKGEVLYALFDLVSYVWSDALRSGFESRMKAPDKLRHYATVLVGGFAVAGEIIRVLETEAMRPGSPLSDLERERMRLQCELLAPVLEEIRGSKATEQWLRVRVAAARAATLELNLGAKSTEPDLMLAGMMVIELLGVGEKAKAGA